MPDTKIDVLMLGQMRPLVIDQLDRAFTLHRAWLADDFDKLIDTIGSKVRAMAAGVGPIGVDASLMQRLPNLELVASFGVGYDDIDVHWARKNGITVTYTPDTPSEEVADTAIGLLISTVRQLPQADRYLRAGKWKQQPFPLGSSLRNRTVGLVGLGRIGMCIARRLDAMKVPVVYHTRRSRPDVPYKYYPSLINMAKAVDVLMLVVPGGSETRAMVDMSVLQALGSTGVLINVSRGSVVNEADLIEALENKIIYSAGLDVYSQEPNVPERLLAMDHVVLLPHIGSSSHYTRDATGQLVVDNILAWAAGKPPLTPVPETPWPPEGRS